MRFGTYYRLTLVKKLKLDNYIRPLDRWLDLGCYDGAILKAFEASQKVGLDLKVRKHQESHFVKGTVEYLPFKEQSMKIITAFDVLEHVKKDYKMINQVENKLVKDGILILSVPHESEKTFPRFLKSWLIFHKWKHIRMGYNRKSLKKLFEGKWKLNFIYWNTNLSNFLYFPLQLLWKSVQKFAKAIIKKVVDLEFIITKKYTSNPGHIILIARRK